MIDLNKLNKIIKLRTITQEIKTKINESTLYFDKPVCLLEVIR